MKSNFRKRTYALTLFLLGITGGLCMAQINPAQLIGDPNNWPDKTQLSTIGQSAGFTILSSESKASSAKPSGFEWRFKLAANGYIEFPELTNLGTITLHLAGGAPNATQVYGQDFDYNTIDIQKKTSTSAWETINTAGSSMPKAEMCKSYTSTVNSEDAISIRVLNSSGYSIWVYAIEVTAFGVVPQDRLPYQNYDNDMPKPGSGSLPYPRSGVEWKSKLIDIDETGKLSYKPDENGFLLPDFSHAGYMNGNTSIPDVPIVKTISAVEGDNTDHIQNAIDEIGAKPLNNDGIRGALLLKKGLYEVKGPIYLKHEGVILKGEGHGADPVENTVIYDSYRDPDGKSNWRSVLLVGNKSADNWNANKRDEENILDDIVPVGAKTIRIKQNKNYKEGDLICIYHPCSNAWLASINFGEVGNDPDKYKDWTTNTAPIYYHRTVTSVSHIGEETIIEFNAPVFYTLKKALSQSVVYKFDRIALQNIGIENIRVDCAATQIPDEDHSWNSIGFVNADNCWARDVVAVHFSQAGFFTQRATGITFERCYALDPIGVVSGERMYNFNQAARSQLILYKECYARGGRHNFVSNGTSTVSGCVVYKCKSEGSRTSSEGHRIWSQGMLFDSYEDFNPKSNNTTLATLGFYNRWNMGSGHGWAMVHGVMWNCNMVTDYNTPEAQANSNKSTKSMIYCEKPPTAQNYAIGCWVEDPAYIKTYRKSIGYVEGTNTPGIKPESLYAAQLNDRRGAPTNLMTQPKNIDLKVIYDKDLGQIEIKNIEIIEELKIFNIYGQKIFNSTPMATNSTISTFRNNTGLILIEIKTKQETQVKKLIL